ncbi:uncharacterized protein LOC128350090 isoform X1 [Hemicordylus capensis]|uniref:uncharacterized protein LOC128350090 isoform X1 n=1 Tax=Hemicordylus capensis TaxID=884348 RepID=UPI002303BEFC|nr:uncharacterized protein LOC128350090 isoform X1 [Hemicordylus capensis]
MGPKKAKAKMGGKQVRPPPCPAPASDSSSEDDGDMGTIRALIACLEALKKERQGVAPRTEKGGPSGVPTDPKRFMRAAKKAKLMQSLTSRIEALEARDQQPLQTVVDVTLDRNGSSNVSEHQGGEPRGPDKQGSGAVLSPAGAGGRASARPDAIVAVEPWRLEAQRAFLASLAPSTQAAYDKQCKVFQEFRMQVGLGQDWPLPAEQLMQFLVHLKGKGLSPRALAGYLAALAFQAKSQGLTNTMGDFRVRRLGMGTPG